MYINRKIINQSFKKVSSKILKKMSFVTLSNDMRRFSFKGIFFFIDLICSMIDRPLEGIILKRI